MAIEDSIKQKTFKSAQDKAVVNILYTYGFLMDHLNPILKKYEITHQQFNVLRILKGCDEPANCAHVKSVMLDKNPDLTRLSDRLLAKGLINRSVNECNRREVALSITKKGKLLLNNVIPEIDKHNKANDNLSDQEAEQLSLLLDKLRG